MFVVIKENWVNNNQSTNYDRIAEAIEYIQQHFKEQPTLDQIAEKVHLSPFHLQKLFTQWAGVSPKKFLQYISIHHAKEMLEKHKLSLFDTASETGLSGTGRLHDLFVNIEGMTPGEFKNQGELLNINYSFSQTLFGEVLVASTAKGVCRLVFMDDQKQAVSELKSKFSNAQFSEKTDNFQQSALKIFTGDWNEVAKVKLHLKATDFQLKVWEALLKIPQGNVVTYGSIATGIHKPKAARAVGTAIGSNPVALLIPCHRVIQSSGMLGGYRWGNTRKTALIGWEAAKVEMK